MASAYSQSGVLENWSQGIRKNPGGDDLWISYNGEDPDQAHAIYSDPSFGPLFRVKGSTSNGKILEISAISPTNPAVFTISNSPITFHTGDRVDTQKITGTGCIGLNSLAGLNATVLSATTFSLPIDATGCSYAGNGQVAACSVLAVHGTGCGVYQNFFPRGRGGYTYPESWISNYVLSGALAATTNRLRYYFRPSKTVLKPANPTSSVDWGTYVHDPNNPDKQQGNHYYHSSWANMYANQWILYEITNRPNHQVSQPDNYWNWPADPEFYVPNQSYQNGKVHYIENLTRFYFDTGYGSGSGVSGIDAFTGETIDWSTYSFNAVTNEPDGFVAERTATYNGAAYEVNFMAPNNLSQHGTIYNVRYSTNDIKSIGWSSAIDGGTVTSRGGSYGYATWTSPKMHAASVLYIGIRPQMLIYSVTNTTPIMVQPEQDSFLSTGDQVAIKNVGGCTKANGTWTVTLLDRASWNKFDETLVGISVDKSGNVAFSTRQPHNLQIGRRVLVPFSGLSNELDTGHYLITNVPSPTTFIVHDSSAVPGNYNSDNRLAVYALQAITLNGSMGCNSTYTNGGTVTAIDDFKNFAEVVFAPPAPRPISAKE
jgi:hypothetical protein